MAALRASVVWALVLKALRTTRRVRSARAVVTSCIVPFFLTLLILGAAIAIGALPAATRRVAIDPAAVRGTFLRPEAVRALGPLVVAVEESPPSAAAAAAAATNSTPLMLDALARALGFADGWASAGSSVAAVASGAQLEARCGGGGAGGSPCLAGLVFSSAASANSGSGGGAYKLRLDKRQALARRFSTNNELRLDVELLAPSLQAAADTALLSGIANASALRAVVVVPNRFVRIKLAEALRDYGGAALFAVCFFATLYAFSLDLLWEKERRVRDGLFVVGVSRTEYGCGWLLVAAGFALPGWVLAAALASGTLPSAGFGALLALYVLAGLASLALCLALDAAFSNADTGPFCVLAFFAGALGAGVALLVGVDQGGASAGTLRAACLLPPAAFVLGFARLADAERAHAVGGAASDHSPGIDLATALGFLAADVLGYLVLALCLALFVPKARGAARRPLFCLRAAMAPPPPPSFPPPPHDGISVRALSKTFIMALSGRSVHALRGVQLDVPPGSITALLGPNGAGKSTLIDILTGVASSTGGDANLGGVSVRSDTARRAGLVGVCPQFDVSIEGLTVRDTLELFAICKGIAAVAAAVADALAALSLVEKAGALVTTLSGGQRRRLSVGVAFLGRPRVVLLDEMSAGVDPVSRRALVDLVLRQRAATGCAVLLTTHFLDEARDVADRVAILVDGEVRCSGTLRELQARFGVGYRLVVRTAVLGPAALDPIVAAHFPCDDSPPPGDGSGCASGNEVQYRLPPDGTAQIAALLRRLLATPGVEGCEVSLQTLEDVFAKVCDGQLPPPPPPVSLSSSSLFHAAEDHAPPSSSVGAWAAVRREAESTSAAGPAGTVAPPPPAPALLPAPPPPQPQRQTLATGWALLLRQLEALARKAVLSGARDWLLLTARLVAPLGSALAASLLLRHRPPSVCVRPPVEPAIPLDSLFLGGNGTLLLGGGGGGAAAAAAAVRGALLERGSLWDVVDGNGTWQSTPVFLAALEALRNSLPPALELAMGGGPVGAPATAGAGAASIAAVANSPEETLPLAALLNLGQNALLWASSPLIGPNASRVVTTFHWFDDAAEAVAMEALDASVIGALALLVLGFTLFAFLSGLPALRERLSGERAVAVASGTSVGALWTVQLAGDAALAALLAALAALVLWLPTTVHPGPSHLLAAEPGWVFAALFAYALAATTATYALSPLVAQPALLLLGLIAVALLHPFVVYLVIHLAITGTQGVAAAGAAVGVVALVCSVQTPATALLVALVRVGNVAQARCETADLSLRPIGQAIAMPLAVLCAQGAVFFFAALAADWLPSWRGWWSATAASPAAAAVHAAAAAPAGTGPPEGAGTGAGIVVRGLEKRFAGMAAQAVDGVSLAVPRAACVALIGDNGCGKTTLFALMCGIATPTRGDCAVEGHSVLGDLPAARRRLALCPQFDALPPRLSVREAVAFHARLKGVPEAGLAAEVDALVAELGLLPHAGQQAGALSGGNRRRASLAAALVGRAPCMLLDEATTGLDALSKRLVWRALVARRARSACVFVTHSLEEAEAVATHVAIMSGGRLLDFGTLPELRARHEGGYTVEVLLAGGDEVASAGGRGADSAEAGAVANAGVGAADPARLLLLQGFPSLASPIAAPSPTLHPERMRFQSRAPLADCFEACERLRAAGVIRDFQVAPTTLETVFFRTLAVGLAESALRRRLRRSPSLSALTLPWVQRGWDSGLGGLSAVAANICWLTLGLGLVPVAFGALFVIVAGIFLFPLYPATAAAARRLVLMATPFSAHRHFVVGGGVSVGAQEDGRGGACASCAGGRPRCSCYWVLVEGAAWLVVGLPTGGAHLLCAAALAASVIGLPFAAVHLRLAALNLSFCWVMRRPEDLPDDKVEGRQPREVDP